MPISTGVLVHAHLNRSANQGYFCPPSLEFCHGLVHCWWRYTLLASLALSRTRHLERYQQVPHMRTKIRIRTRLNQTDWTKLPIGAPCKTGHLLLVSRLRLESPPNCRSCRGKPPSLDRQSYKRVANLAECSAPCKTGYLLLVSRLRLESPPNCRSCRGKPPSLDRQSYKRVANHAECSAPCKTRHSPLVSGYLRRHIPNQLRKYIERSLQIADWSRDRLQNQERSTHMFRGLDVEWLRGRVLKPKAGPVAKCSSLMAL